VKENPSPPDEPQGGIRPPLIWKMQFNVVTIFILLICTFALIIILFTNYRSYREVMNLSSVVTSQANKGVIGTVSGITGQVQLLAETAKGFVRNQQDVSGKNEALVSYLLNALIKGSYVYRISIATDDGNMLSVTNVALSNQAVYYLNPGKSLPVGAQYAIRVVNRTGPDPGEVWEYKNSNLVTIETEQLPAANYDPRSESWYTTVQKWPHLRWDTAPIYAFGESAVSVSVPIVNDAQKVFAAVNVNLSLNQISSILALQKIGKTGRAFILNARGEVLVPKIEASTPTQDAFPAILKSAYKTFKDEKTERFILTNEKVRYLINITDFPLDYETKWIIAVVVPFNDFFGPILKTQRQTVLISFSILVLFGLLVYLASKYISAPIVQLADSVDRIHNFDFREPRPVKSHISEIVSLNASIRAMRIALSSFARYIPREIVQSLIKQGQEIEIGGERRDLTVLFSDIENFTTVAEALNIDKLTPALSEYFEALSKTIVKSEGTIDKFIGDSIMAFWNAPNLVVDQGDKACMAALRCLSLTNHSDQPNILLKGRTRFGIHSGEAIVGNIGTSERMNYTAIGNVVNTAARLQSLNKIYGTSILISETVHEKIGTRFVTRPVDFIVVKGRTKGITIFELVGVREGEERELIPRSEQMDLCAEFATAYGQFHAGRVDEAKAALLALHQKFPTDKVTELYLERLQAPVEKKA
jgi:adenylate cyclase